MQDPQINLDEYVFNLAKGDSEFLHQTKDSTNMPEDERRRIKQQLLQAHAFSMYEYKKAQIQSRIDERNEAERKHRKRCKLEGLFELD